jgi:hypothetical protein
MLKRKNKYFLESEIVTLKDSKKLNPKNRSIQKFLAALVIIFFSTAGLITSVTLPAQAAGGTTCPLDTTKNPWVQGLGGLNTRSFDTAKGSSSIAKMDGEATIRDRWFGRVTFTSWLPAIYPGGSSSEPRNILKVVPNNFADKLSDKGYYEAQWTEYIAANLQGNEEVAGTALIRQNEKYETDFFFQSGQGCINNVFFEHTLGMAGANFLLGMANSINGIGTFLYVNANTGTNLTQAIGLQSSSTLEGLYVNSTEEENWSVALGRGVEEVLVGNGKEGTGLYNSLYLTFLLPVVFIGAIIVLVNGIKRRAIEIVTGIVWMIVVIASGTLFMTKPMLIPQTIDALIITVSNEVNKAVIGSGNDQNLGCEPTKELIPDEAKRNAKATECYIWYNTIYKPYVQGQFGVTFGAVNGNQETLLQDNEGALTSKISVAGRTLAYKDIGGWGAYQLENMHNPLGSNVAIAMSRNDNSSMFIGADKFANGFLALVVSLAITVFIGVNAFLILAYQIVMALLLLTAPLFFIVGIMPSKTGKGIMLRWAELVIGLAVKRLVITVLMAFFIKMFLVISSIPQLGVWFQAIIFAVLAYVGITQRGKIMEMFTANISFGGDKKINVGGKVEALGKSAPNIAAGAVGAGAGWASARTAAGVRFNIAEKNNEKFKKTLSGKNSEEKAELIKQRQASNDKRAAIKSLQSGDSNIKETKALLDDRTISEDYKDELRSNSAKREALQRETIDATYQSGEKLDSVSSSIESSASEIRQRHDEVISSVSGVGDEVKEARWEIDDVGYDVKNVSSEVSGVVPNVNKAGEDVSKVNEKVEGMSSENVKKVINKRPKRDK